MHLVIHATIAALFMVTTISAAALWVSGAYLVWRHFKVNKSFELHHSGLISLGLGTIAFGVAAITLSSITIERELEHHLWRTVYQMHLVKENTDGLPELSQSIHALQTEAEGTEE